MRLVFFFPLYSSSFFFLVNCGTNWTVQYFLHHERKEGVRSIEKWSCIGNQLAKICSSSSSFGLFCLFCCVHSHVCIYVWVTCHMLDIWSGAHRGTIESNFFYLIFFYFSSIFLLSAAFSCSETLVVLLLIRLVMPLLLLLILLVIITYSF